MKKIAPLNWPYHSSMFGYNLVHKKGEKNEESQRVPRCSLALSKGDETVMGYHPGHAVTPGVEGVFSVDCSKSADIANWTGVVNFVYNIHPKTLAISSLEQKRGDVLTARKQSALRYDAMRVG